MKQLKHISELKWMKMRMTNDRNWSNTHFRIGFQGQTVAYLLSQPYQCRKKKTNVPPQQGSGLKATTRQQQCSLDSVPALPVDDPNNVENHRNGKKQQQNKTHQDSHPSNINHPPSYGHLNIWRIIPYIHHGKPGGCFILGKPTTWYNQLGTHHFTTFPDGAPRQRKLWEVCSCLESADRVS